MILRKTVFVILAGITFVACKEKSKDPMQSSHNVEVVVQPTFGATPLYLDSTYTTSQGYDIQFTDIKFYVQDMRDGNKVLLDAALFDLRQKGYQLGLAVGEASSFQNITSNLGVDSILNHSDPAAFPNNSALNIANANDMHWGWNPGYIFVKIEAKVDTIPDGNPLFDHFVVYHVGLDANMQTLSFNNLQWELGSFQDRLALKLDMQAFLAGPQPIDVKTEYTTHSAAGQEVLTLKVAQNFAAALSLL